MRPSRKKTESSATGAREQALRALVRREHSAAELRRKLEYRGVSAEHAVAALEGLQTSGLQSDRRYAESLVRSRVSQGYGPLRIEAELEQARVAVQDIRACLGNTELDWKVLAAEQQQRKFRELPKRPADWQKQYRYLAGKGFTLEQIRAALKGEPPDD